MEMLCSIHDQTSPTMHKRYMILQDIKAVSKVPNCMCIRTYHLPPYCTHVWCRFLYQVFPGTTSQCQRLLLRAARTGEITTVQKLVHKHYAVCIAIPRRCPKYVWEPQWTTHRRALGMICTSSHTYIIYVMNCHVLLVGKVKENRLFTAYIDLVWQMRWLRDSCPSSSP